MKAGDIAQIKHEAEIVIVLEVWDGTNQVTVLRNDRRCHMPADLLEVL